MDEIKKLIELKDSINNDIIKKAIGSSIFKFNEEVEQVSLFKVVFSEFVDSNLLNFYLDTNLDETVLINYSSYLNKFIYSVDNKDRTKGLLPVSTMIKKVLEEIEKNKKSSNRKIEDINFKSDDIGSLSINDNGLKEFLYDKNIILSLHKKDIDFLLSDDNRRLFYEFDDKHDYEYAFIFISGKEYNKKLHLRFTSLSICNTLIHEGKSKDFSESKIIFDKFIINKEKAIEQKNDKEMDHKKEFELLKKIRDTNIPITSEMIVEAMDYKFVYIDEGTNLIDKIYDLLKTYLPPDFKEKYGDLPIPGVSILTFFKDKNAFDAIFFESYKDVTPFIEYYRTCEFLERLYSTCIKKLNSQELERAAKQRSLNKETALKEKNNSNNSNNSKTTKTTTTMATSTTKTVKTVKTGNKMNNMMEKMMETMRSRFMPEQIENVKVSIDGNLCVLTKDGWVSANDNNELVLYPEEMVFNLVPVYTVHRPVNQLCIGDIIVTSRSFSKVLGATNDGKLKTLSFSGYNRTEVPIKDFMFGKSVKVLINMLPMLKASGIDPMGMAMMSGEVDFESLMMMQMFGGQGMGNMMGGMQGGMGNIMQMSMMSQMFGKKKSNNEDEEEEEEGTSGMFGGDMMQMYMMSQMFGGGMGNMFGNMFRQQQQQHPIQQQQQQQQQQPVGNGFGNMFGNMFGGNTGGVPVFNQEAIQEVEKAVLTEDEKAAAKKAKNAPKPTVIAKLESEEKAK